MALTKIGTDGVKDDAITSGKIPANAVGTSEIADQAVTLAKLEHGTSSNDGKFLRANNGADPTFETVNTDLVSDTSPQLGGALDMNNQNITSNDSSGGGNNRIVLGSGADFQLWHDGNHSYIADEGTGNLRVQTNNLRIENAAGTENQALFTENGSVELYYDNSKKFETTSYGSKTTGYHTQSAPISWLAYADSQWYTMTAGQSIYPFSFNNIAHNIGGHWKNSGSDEGLFVAPVAGVYQLNWNIFVQGLTDSDTGNTLEMYVRKNGSSVSYLHNKKGYGNMGDDQQIINLSVATQLAANDKVGVIFSAYGATWRIYGGHSTFSGFLVG